MMTEQQHPDLLKSAEVAALFRVDTKTVNRWANEGKLPCIKTLGGHRRFRRQVVDRLLASGYEVTQP